VSEKEAYRIVWKKIIDGDEKALSELYKQHYLALINYGIKIIDDKDLVNNCFMQMLIEFWDKRYKLLEVENVRPYLITSLRRAIFQAIKLDKRLEMKHNESQENSYNYEWSYEEYLIKLQSDNNLRSKITKAIEKLTNRQKELIRLKFFDNLSYDEIAEQNGITKRTAYNIIYDAIKILKEELHADQNSSFTLNFLLQFILQLAF
jgi:RNA polymerase sigma factor (sigma-70 family)